MHALPLKVHWTLRRLTQLVPRQLHLVFTPSMLLPIHLHMLEHNVLLVALAVRALAALGRGEIRLDVQLLPRHCAASLGLQLRLGQ
eukprot:151934-Rhodomonas_salina.1